MTYVTGPQITPWQRQIVLGTVLGGSSIVKPKKGRNAYLSMRGKDGYWIEYKSQELSNLASPTSLLVESENQYFRWHSHCYPEFNDFIDLFYAEGVKVVSMGTLNELRDIGLAIWYLDGGKLEDGSVIFNTNSYGPQGTKMICRYFTEIGFDSSTFITKKSCRVMINEESVDKFFKLIGHRVPEFMLHRLAEKA